MGGLSTEGGIFLGDVYAIRWRILRFPWKLNIGGKVRGFVVNFAEPPSLEKALVIAKLASKETKPLSLIAKGLY